MASIIAKSLSRLPYDALIDLCSKWAQSENSIPYLTTNRKLIEADEEDYLHEPAESSAALKDFYLDLRSRGDEKDKIPKRDIIDRVVDGDWRHGLSLQQLADIDLANLEQHDTTLRWSALKLVPFRETDTLERVQPIKKRKISHSTKSKSQSHYPTISPANFIANLKSHISPLVKAHYTLYRLKSNLVVLRLYIMPNIPFAPLSSNVPRNIRQATDSGSVMYIALPDSCPYIYISLSGSTGSGLATRTKEGGTASKNKIDMAATKRIILEAIPKVMSKPQERWSLENTKLTCRSLKAIGLLRGNTRPGSAGGCYSKFSEEIPWQPKKPIETPNSTSSRRENDARDDAPNQAEHTPLTVSEPSTMTPPTQPDSIHENQVTTRFGSMDQPTHAKLDRFHLTISNILLEPTTSKFNTPPPSQPPNSRPKRKRRSLEDIEAGRVTPEPASVLESGVAPVQPSSSSKVKDSPAQISITFSGVDVFRGLRELALVDGGKYIDLDRLPGYLTGQQGVSVYTI